MLVVEEKHRLKDGMMRQIRRNNTGKKDLQYCAACGQAVTAHRHKVTWAQAVALAVLVDMCEREPGYHHVDAIKDEVLIRLKETHIVLSHWSVLAKWNLIEDQPHPEDAEKRCSGMWRPTQLGYDFVYGHIDIDGYLWTYNNKVQARTGGKISIQMATSEQYSWPEMQGIMRGNYDKK